MRLTEWKIHKPLFEADQYNISVLPVSPWAGHREFAYDLVINANPRKIVELGTHYGCSFFAFCQAVKDSGRETEVYAIDTWKGDEHAGEYGEEVIQIVKHTLEHSFSRVNAHLLRGLFDEHIDSFEDESIDILHIDGFHTYEAVQHDFESWLPKLSVGGIILFHDVSSATGYGSSVFWQDIKMAYPHFEFEHNWGLGILFPKGDKLFKQVNECIDFNILLNYYHNTAYYKLYALQVKDNEHMIQDRDKLISNMEGMIQERDKSIEALRLTIREYNKSIDTLGRFVGSLIMAGKRFWKKYLTTTKQM